MRCKKCKAQLKKGSLYCGSCGEAIKKPRKWLIILVIAAIVVVTAAIGIWFWLNMDSSQGQDSEQGSDQNSEQSRTEVEIPDEYEYQETVLEEIDAASSEAVPTVSEVASELDERGFSDYEITASYDISGNFISDEYLQFDSEDKYPLYTIYYVTSSGYPWVIYVSNGEYMANPLFLYDSISPSLLLSENEYTVAYEADQNIFIKSIPGENEVTLKIVDTIDAQTLDSLDEDAVMAL